MKSLLVFARIFIVGCLWCIIFTEGIRVIMLCNWHFDIFWPDHWRQLKTLWNAGWSAHAAKEWAFAIILFTFFPMLITGWWTLCLLSWEDIVYQIITSPVTLYRYFIKQPINVLTTNNQYGIVKRKSYKQIRPAGVGSRIQTPISDYGSVPALPFSTGGFPVQQATTAYSSTSAKVMSKNKKTDIPSTIDHALFKFDDDDDDFDLDIDSFEKTDINKANSAAKSKKTKEPEIRSSNRFEDDFDDDFDDDIVPRKNSKEEKRARRDNDEEYSKSSNRRDDNTNGKQRKGSTDKNATESKEEGNKFGPVYDILQQKNYAVLNNIAVNDITVDFIGISQDSICLCLVDKEAGDWLADEEMFNGEDPLWFSESSHRVSPVCRLKKACDIIKDKLDDEGFELQVKPYVVIQMANIINADDMFEVWENMNIDVTRINRGAPKEIRLFSKTLEDSSGRLAKKDFERLQKLLKGLH